jgi:TonB family protein
MAGRQKWWVGLGVIALALLCPQTLYGQDSRAPDAGATDAGQQDVEQKDGRESDEQDVSGASEPADVRPPRLERGVDPAFPDDAPDGRDRARVVLELTVDETGSVVDAQVGESGGDAFDDAALDLVDDLEFEPATRGGEPIKARIRLSFEFERPPPPKGRIDGRVLFANESAEPVVGAQVELTGPSEVEEVTRTDAEGRFRFEELDAGSYTLRVVATGLQPQSLQVPVEAGSTSTPTIRLDEEQAEPALEVTVRGKSESQQLRESAQAVNVVDTEDDQSRTADLGEVVARSEGAGVRRAGGLGSTTRFSLNGLSGDQIRFFLDGVPLEFAGYPFGLANVPVNLVDRVEIYRGVVPVRFGADALGGAVNLVSDQQLSGTHVSGSYQAGSFGTHRFTLSGRHLDEATGLFARVTGFHDFAENDYQVDVEVPAPNGRPQPATVYRFHDAYRATGANAEFGLVERPWADRLLARAFVTDFTNEVQHNNIMAIPYGGVEFGDLSAGGNLRYEHAFTDAASIDAVAGYAHTRSRALDKADCVYDWFGQCRRDRDQLGEVDGLAPESILWRHNGFARLHAEWNLDDAHDLRFSISPTYTTQTGDERERETTNAPDPLEIRQSLFTLVSGVEHELRLFDDRLEAVTFVKHYLQAARTDELLVARQVESRDRDSQRVGFGEAVRFELVDSLFAKASYEWATRLPRAAEVFGNGALIVPNLELGPETSHNLNVGLSLVELDVDTGRWNAELNGFLRDSDELILLLGNDLFFSYQNVFGARSLGAEVSAEWTSPGDYVSLSANSTYQDFRNTSDQGTFAKFDGDRIPNQPYLFANAAAAFRLDGLAADEDTVSLRWNTRYVHDYFRSWASVGRIETKQTIPSQLLHSAALTYGIDGDPLSVSFTTEVQNVTDESAFDFFGVQRPGRGVYFKLTGTY